MRNVGPAGVFFYRGETTTVVFYNHPLLLVGISISPRAEPKGLVQMLVLILFSISLRAEPKGSVSEANANASYH